VTCWVAMPAFANSFNLGDRCVSFFCHVFMLTLRLNAAL
jgi:hypothetical protein